MGVRACLVRDLTPDVRCQILARPKNHPTFPDAGKLLGHPPQTDLNFGFTRGILVVFTNNLNRKIQIVFVSKTFDVVFESRKKFSGAARGYSIQFEF